MDRLPAPRPQTLVSPAFYLLGVLRVWQHLSFHILVQNWPDLLRQTELSIYLPSFPSGAFFFFYIRNPKYNEFFKMEMP